jgi:orotidine-5'-phosphate decarboxylase
MAPDHHREPGLPEERAALCVALDMKDPGKAAALARRLAGTADMIKVGMELFYAAGREGWREIAGAGLPVFLDLKLHDIPNTVARATESLLELTPPPAIINVHAAGGPAMLKAAAEATAGRCLLVAVTVLTALDARDLATIGIDPGLKPEDLVLRLARLAAEAGLDGVVCSPREVAVIRQELGPDFLTVVPGIRPAGAEQNDQKRIATPEAAQSAGARVIVVGRPVTQAPDPVTAAARIRETLTGARTARSNASH